MNHPGYCAYHSSTLIGQKRVLFANLPYAAISGCASGQSPQGGAADSVLNTLSHEYLETMTDPLGTGWFDNAGLEIADKCVSAYGTPLGTNAFGKYNQQIRGHSYWLQEMWSNRASACVQRNNTVQPVASYTYMPTAPVHGQPVAFHSTSHNNDATPIKLRWTFPNGFTSAAANPSFTFAAAGTFTVSLVVWDTQGDQARVQKVITVS